VSAVLFSEESRNLRKRGTHREGYAAYAEYVALLHATAQPESSNQPVDPNALAAIVPRVDHLFIDTLKLYSRAMPLPETATFEERIQSRVRRGGLLARNPGYSAFWYEILQEFATQYDPGITTTLGISFAEMLLLARTAHAQSSATYFEWAETIDHHTKRLTKMLRRGPHRWRRLTGPDRVILDVTHSQPPRQRRAALGTMVQFSRLSSLRSAVMFTAARLAAAANVDVSVAARFLQLFSTAPDEILAEHILLPSPLNPLARTPFLAIDGEYLLPNPALPLWSLLPRCDQLLNPDSANSWPTASEDRYRAFDKRRAQFLETAVANVLRRVGFTSSEVGLLYDNPAGADFETDVIGLIDDTLVIAECKAGTLNDVSRRGGTLSIRTDVKTMLREGYEQSVRADQHARVGTFRDDQGRVVDFRGRFDTSIRLVVSLDHTAIITSAAVELREANFFSQGPAVLLSLLDLIEVVDIIGTPWAVKHYLLTRMRAIVSDVRVIVQDEYDYLAMYTHTYSIGLPGIVLVSDSRGVFDNHFRGLARRSVYEMMHIPRSVRELIEALARRASTHWTSAVGALLDLGPNPLKECARRLAHRTSELAAGWANIFIAVGEHRVAIVPYAGIDMVEARVHASMSVREHGVDPATVFFILWNLETDLARAELSTDALPLTRLSGLT
jgi:hypothetical protein